jgi:hypothetical protein
MTTRSIQRQTYRHLLQPAEKDGDKGEPE